MKHVKKSILLWYSPQQMYDLVVAIEDYPQFLPWCDKAEVLSRDEGSVAARLSLRYAGVKQSFTTRNTQVPPESVMLQLVDGPFSLLEGRWQFTPVGNGASGEACRIDFEMRYSFANRALDLVVSPVFDRIANTFVDSFVKRAEAVYGKR